MINAGDVKKIRETTGLSIKECKHALEKSKGNLEDALEILSSQGLKNPSKYSARKTGAGIVESYIHNNGAAGAILELRCETDFVARNETFKALAHDIAMQIVATNPESKEELLTLPFIKDETRTVKDEIDKAISLLGENITIGKFSRIQL